MFRCFLLRIAYWKTNTTNSMYIRERIRRAVWRKACLFVLCQRMPLHLPSEPQYLISYLFLLRWNSPNVTWTVLKSTVRWYFVHSQGYATTASPWFRNIFVTPHPQPKKKIPYSLSSRFPYPSLPQPLATTVCFVSSRLYWSSHKRNHIICGLVCLACFTQHVFTIRSHCSMLWSFLPFHGWIILRCMGGPRVVYPGPFCFVFIFTMLNYLQLLPSFFLFFSFLLIEDLLEEF